uniref:Rpn family recombination-promoting nuclease/putative transposase n=1 Tax=Desulfatirhabdium butyrativorans TaxID=340467 RepID=A0A7C4RTK1_9BACT
MHHYDIAAKVLIDTCRDQILRELLHLDVDESTLIEGLPQETVSVKRSDFPMLVTDSKGRQSIVILEIQTQWNPHVPLHLLDYRIRHILSKNLPAISAIVLLKADARAIDHYEDSEVRFQYQLIRLSEMDAKEAIEQWPFGLLPFIPLLKHGPELTPRVEQMIYDEPISSLIKADMLTSMTILTGLVSDILPQDILSRRRDIMIESAAYDIIKQDGLQQGIQQGIQQGLQEGKLFASKEALFDVLMERFDRIPSSIIQAIDRIDNAFLLKTLLRIALKAPSIEAFHKEFDRLVG